MTAKPGKWDGDIFDDPKLLRARAQVIKALEQCPKDLIKHLNPKLRGLQACGHFAVAVRIKDNHVVGVIRNRCRCRACPVCDSLLAAETRRGLKLLFEEREAAGGRFSMITVTIPHSRKDSAKTLVDLVFAAMSKFHRSPVFKRYVRGWVRGVEVPWNPENGFNPHAHYLVEASLWPKEEIKALWSACMRRVGGPEVPPHGTHVKGIADVGAGLMEAVGYPFKVADLSGMPAAELCELLRATKGRHLTQLSGPWAKRLKALSDDADDLADVLDEGEGGLRVSVAELGAQAMGGNRMAFDLLVEAAQWLARHWTTGGLAARMAGFLRAAAKEHDWPVPDLPDAGPDSPVLA